MLQGRSLWVCIVLSLLISVSVFADNPNAVPTFECIGLYWKSDQGCNENKCEVQYRQTGQAIWQQALDLWFDDRDPILSTDPNFNPYRFLPEDRQDEYRGSIVNLYPGTEYEIQLNLIDPNNFVLDTETITATTWSEEFPVKETVQLNPYYDRGIKITEGGNAEDGYVVYEASPGGTLFDMNDELDYYYIGVDDIVEPTFHDWLDINNDGNPDPNGWRVSCAANTFVSEEENGLLRLYSEYGDYVAVTAVDEGGATISVEPGCYYYEIELEGDPNSGDLQLNMGGAGGVVSTKISTGGLSSGLLYPTAAGSITFKRADIEHTDILVKSVKIRTYEVNRLYKTVFSNWNTNNANHLWAPEGWIVNIETPTAFISELPENKLRLYDQYGVGLSMYATDESGDYVVVQPGTYYYEVVLDGDPNSGSLQLNVGEGGRDYGTKITHDGINSGILKPSMAGKIALKRFKKEYTDAVVSSVSVIKLPDVVEYCLSVEAPYVIIKGLELKNAMRHGIWLATGVHHVVIEECDISNWGSQDDEGFGTNFDSAIYARYPYEEEEKVKQIVIQRNKIHHPRYDSNNWTEYREEQGNYHPSGPQAVSMFNSAGNHVIRYNEVYSDPNHYFNDIFGSGDNGSTEGFPNCDSDIYGNILKNCWDDPIESEGANQNVRIWGNYIDHTYMKVSIAPTAIGPVYVWRNIGGVAERAEGVNSGYFIKTFSIGTYPISGSGRIYVFHNTVLQPENESGHKLGSSTGFGSPFNHDTNNVITRNNIFDATWGSVYSRLPRDLDYDMYRINYLYDESGNYTQDEYEVNGFAQTRPVYSPSFGFTLENGKGNFQLAAETCGYDDGIEIPNFNDHFRGSHPDIGAHESGCLPMEFGVNAYQQTPCFVDNDGNQHSGYNPADPLGTVNHPYLSIQSAINDANDFDKIVVYPGTYYESIDFLGKAITVRSINPNDGGIVEATIIDSNSLYDHVVTFADGEGAGSILSGFTITGGYANGVGTDDSGAGAYCYNTSPTIQNCLFRDNYAAEYGGGVYVVNSNIEVSNCVFENNSADEAGGGFRSYKGQPVIDHCTFELNSSSVGGAIQTAGSTGYFSNCIFFDNFASLSGGAIRCIKSEDNQNYSLNTILNSLFVGNSAPNGGAIHNKDGSDTMITNCTFTDNYASAYGGAIRSSGDSDPVITNCILWGNSASTDNEISNSSASDVPVVSYSDVAGGYTGTDNINADPIFVDDYYLTSASPCVDAGDPNGVYTGQTDIEGDDRVIDGDGDTVDRVDMGADEYNPQV